MSQTPVSLLERLRLRPDQDAWRRLLHLYEPMLRGWLRRYAVQAADADDMIQEICGVMLREIPAFDHGGRPGAFRRWLRGVMVNRLRVFWRERRKQPHAACAAPQNLFEQLEDPASELSRLWDAEHDQHVTRRLLALLQPEFEPTTWRAFQLLVLEGRPTAEVARELGISVNAVRLAKSRVLRRLRQEAAGLIDWT